MLEVQAPDHISRKSRDSNGSNTFLSTRQNPSGQRMFALDQMQQIPVGVSEKHQTVALI
jgi:hypothetical protein